MQLYSVTTDLYYSASWQVLEERIANEAVNQYVWSLTYIDAMVLRDRATGGNGTLDERLWVMQDANWNVMALVSGSGNVVERFGYDPYGVRTVYDGNYTLRSGGSAYGFVYGFQGLRYDATAELNFTHTRPYSPALGRFTGPDWIRFDGGDVNLYRMEQNNPVVYIDPSGQNPVLIAAGLTTVGLAVAAIQIYKEVEGDAKRLGWTNDKFKHCVASCRLARRYGARVSQLIGTNKEILDEIAQRLGAGGNGFEATDWFANQDGIGFAGIETSISPVCGWFGQIFRSDCATLCATKHKP